MKVRLLQEEIELISKALMTHRWEVERNEGQTDEFHRCASLMDKLAFNHNGGELSLNPPSKE